MKIQSSEGLTSIIERTLANAVESQLVGANGMPRVEFEPCVYVRDVAGRSGCPMGDVVVDCVNVDANAVACMIRSWHFDGFEGHIGCCAGCKDDNAIECEVIGARIIVRESSAFEFAELLRDDLLCDENWANVCYVPHKYSANGGAS